MDQEKDNQVIIPSREAAAICGVTTHTLIMWRAEGYGPKPLQKLGQTFIYDKAEVEEFARKRAAALEVLGWKPSGSGGRVILHQGPQATIAGLKAENPPC